MSKAKKLDLQYEKLCEIAKALNENIIENRLRSKDERITTDHFIREKFNISRKDFGYTAKEFGIKYNSTNFFYEIPGYNCNTTVVNKVEPTVIKQNASEEMAATSEEDTTNYNSNNSSLENNLSELIPTLLEMIDWYKEQRNKVIENQDPLPSEINLNNEKLCGAIGIHSIKCYESIFNDFLEICNLNKAYKKYDLFSLALLEFVDKYKK